MAPIVRSVFIIGYEIHTFSLPLIALLASRISLWSRWSSIDFRFGLVFRISYSFASSGKCRICEKSIRITSYNVCYTKLLRGEVEQLIAKHQEAPHLRELQKKLAEEVTVMVHSRADYEMAVEASQILFGSGTADTLRKLDEATFLSVFEGVPQFVVSKTALEAGVNVVDLLSDHAAVFPSKGELRRTIKGNGLSINKEKIADQDLIVMANELIGGKYLLVQKGKKNYFLLIVE